MTTPALIQSKAGKVYAVFQEAGKPYQVVLDPSIYQSKIGSRIEIRYELSAPQHAKVNQAIGYWLEPKELVGAFFILIVLLIAAYATTYRPNATSLKEQIAFKKEDNGKYI